ncbi:uncharacterized protein LOC132799214 isoform X3 [Ziziphus jujuba]|uniref:Uncharacterized protein LOC132799214 isoform X3 n=1 Tax=Ziziphus jujuba TaxID=326968 RepID=A0ABM3ZZY2_ZIZJJ|nr:uncharacterized protein LOC132799214 isoform X3 [Ziziphus jujuba]
MVFFILIIDQGREHSAWVYQYRMKMGLLLGCVGEKMFSRCLLFHLCLASFHLSLIFEPERRSCNSEEPLKLYLEDAAMEHHRLALQEGVIHIDQWRGHSAGNAILDRSKVAASVLWFSTVHNTAQALPVSPSSTTSSAPSFSFINLILYDLSSGNLLQAVANGSHVCFQYNSSTNSGESLKLYLDFGEAFSGTSWISFARGCY